MIRLTDRLTSEVATNIIVEQLDHICDILKDNKNKRFITLIFPSEQTLDTRIKKITQPTIVLGTYKVVVLADKHPPEKIYIDAFPIIKTAIDNKTLTCVCIATIHGENVSTHCATTFMMK